MEVFWMSFLWFRNRIQQPSVSHYSVTSFLWRFFLIIVGFQWCMLSNTSYLLKSCNFCNGDGDWFLLLYGGQFEKKENKKF